jgi:hypothetical protein
MIKTEYRLENCTSLNGDRHTLSAAVQLEELKAIILRVLVHGAFAIPARLQCGLCIATMLQLSFIINCKVTEPDGFAIQLVKLFNHYELMLSAGSPEDVSS